MIVRAVYEQAAEIEDINKPILNNPSVLRFLTQMHIGMYVTTNPLRDAAKQRCRKNLRVSPPYDAKVSL